MDELILSKLNSFFSQFKSVDFKKGELLIRADEEPAGIFFIQSGVIKQYIISQKGDELVVNIFKSPSFFPLSWAINDEKNMYFYEALSDARVWRAPKADVLEFLKSDKDVMFDLLSRIYRGLEGLLTRTTYLMSGNARNRLIVELIIFAKRFGTVQEETGTLTCAVTETELAAHAGLTRETVSREMGVLKKMKVLSFKKGILEIPSLSDLQSQLLHR